MHSVKSCQIRSERELLFFIVFKYTSHKMHAIVSI